MPNPYPAEMRLKMKREERTRIGRELITKIRLARDGMKSLLETKKAWDRLYEHNLPEKTVPYKGCSNLNVPFIQSHVDGYHAHCNTTILDVRPRMKIQPPSWMVGPEAKEIASKVENAVEEVFMSKMNIVDVINDINHYALRNRACIVKLPWREEYRTEKRYTTATDDWGNPVVDENMQPVMVATEIQAPKYVGPRPELVDLTNFVIYPLTTPSIDTCSLVGDRFRLTPDQLRRRIKEGYYDKEPANRILDRPDNELASPDDLYDSENNELLGIERLDHYEHWFWEVIAPYDADGDGISEDCCFVVDANDGIVVRATKYPYFHGRRYYIAWRPFQRPCQFFGGCIPQVLEGVQRELNAIHNQRVDAMKFAMLKIFKMRRNSSMDPDAIELSPGVVIQVDDMDDLQNFDINPTIPGADIEEQVREHGERAIASNDLALGINPGGDKTAQEVSIVSAKSGVRFNDVVRRLQQSNIEMTRQVMGLMYQFSPDEELAAYEVQREWLVIPWDIIPHGNMGTADKVQQRQEALSLYQLMFDTQNPLVLSDPMHVYRLTQDVLMAFDRQDVEAYLGTEEELQMKLQQAAMQQQQMAEQQMAMAQQQQQMQMQQGEQEQMMQSQDKQADRETQLQLAKMKMQGANAKTRK